MGGSEALIERTNRKPPCPRAADLETENRVADRANAGFILWLPPRWADEWLSSVSSGSSTGDLV